ncbi:hypothetical protein [Geoalkalibacter sp.]|uniref:hypothetical protein n=1 Tax=Geoalkalibacter sp. TaxID=3041440 RepID=UPI00272E5BE7|nr:hypothetical protein [Geoalkalibacter sp.]
MFALEPERFCLDVAAGQVVRLLRSSNPVQVALSGFPGQRAGAFVCIVRAAVGLDVFVALELYDSRRLVFYRGEAQGRPAQDAGALVDEGLAFVEAMGFLMVDLEMEGLAPEQRERFWALLPLSTGRIVGSGAILPGDALASAVAVAGVSGARSQAVPLREDIEARRRQLLDNLGRILAAF